MGKAQKSKRRNLPKYPALSTKDLYILEQNRHDEDEQTMEEAMSQAEREQCELCGQHISQCKC
jgi:hypothetical protein